MNEFKESKDVLAGEAAAQAKLRKLLAKKANWDSPEDVALYTSIARMTRRRAILQELVPDKICPLCKEGPFPESKQWVVNVKEKVAVCRSCWVSSRKSRGVFALDIFGLPELRYPVDGARLQAAREEIGVTMSRMSAKMNWSEAYWSRLENGYVRTIDEDTAKRIVELFKSMGLEVKAIRED